MATPRSAPQAKNSLSSNVHSFSTGCYGSAGIIQDFEGRFIYFSPRGLAKLSVLAAGFAGWSPGLLSRSSMGLRYINGCGVFCEPPVVADVSAAGKFWFPGLFFVAPGDSVAGPVAAIPFAQMGDLREIILMASETFKTSHWTRGNFLFPTYIEITDTAVIRRKRSWFRKDEMSISISKVASVHIQTGIIWSDILIESTGGSDPMKSHGHSKLDAIRIRDLIQGAQGMQVTLGDQSQQNLS